MRRDCYERRHEAQARIFQRAEALRDQSKIVAIGGSSSAIATPLAECECLHVEVARLPELVAILVNAAEGSNCVCLGAPIASGNGQHACSREKVLCRIEIACEMIASAEIAEGCGETGGVV